LRRGGYELQVERVQTPEAMTAALEQQTWDIVFSDYSMPRFSATAALAVVKDKGLDLPFIIVSGTIGEETAVAAMRAGAHDFMPKDTLVRLLPAVERELREAANRAERRKMREQLLISDRMASVGTLAASVAHEINNPLTVLVANLDMAAEALKLLTLEAGLPDASGSDDDADGSGPWATRLAKVEVSLRDAQEAAERVRLITRDLKVFSRSGDEEQRGPVEIRPVLESAIRMASNEIRHRARLVKDYGDVPPVEGNESRLGQVFLNLIVNAAQAIPEGRTDSNEIRIATRLGDDGRVVVEIADTGGGIPQDVLARIFDPFFTTKPVGVGTGLGLAICHRIVSGLGGEIKVESHGGKGSVFRTALPQARTAAATDSAAAPTATGGRRGQVLVVDDERALCATIERMLAGEHDVVALTAASEALRLIVDGRRFDVILCDLMMPEMTGMDLHAELLRLAPEQAERLVFMTGGAFTQNARAYLDKVPTLVVDKPFKADTLRDLVRRRLR
jgi:signal transduction histidine kinase